MTQPPDERQRPDQPGDVGPDEPTVAWTPPDGGSAKPPEEGGVGWAAVPDEPTPAPPPDQAPATPERPAEPTPLSSEPPPAPEPPLAPEPPPAPGGPIISAAPSASPPEASGWQTPTPPPSAPGSGWQLPADAAAAPHQQGYVIAGVGARFVAWLIDITLVAWVPGLLTLAVIDWRGLIDEVMRQYERDPSGSLSGSALTLPITTELILATVIGLGVQYLYFVGFWTSRWRATPGMIGLKLQVADAATGGPLTIVQATKRWIALGWPLSLLTLVPALQAIGGYVSLAVYVILFLTTVTNDRKQGLHDRLAGSLVVRSVSSGNGATFVGCLVWGILVVLTLLIAGAFLVGVMGPQFEDFIREIRETDPSNVI